MAEMWPMASWGIIREDVRPTRWGINPADVDVIHEAVTEEEDA
jgi:hypothetical protein